MHETKLFMSNHTLLKLLLPLSIAVTAASCISRSYYVSPAFGNNHYVTKPLQKSNEQSALYANGAFSIGNANDALRDNQYAFQGNIYNVHQFSLFKAWYGGGLSLGSYEVTSSHMLIDNRGNKNLEGWKFFGTGNIEGGATVVMPFGNGGEWRVLGISGNLYNEFGKYHSFRNSLNPDSVSGVATSRTLGSLGFSTEIVGKLRNGSVGWTLQANMMLGSQYKDTEFGKNPYNKERYSYVSNTVQLTLNELTYYAQANIGVRLLNCQMGVNYKILSSRKKQYHHQY